MKNEKWFALDISEIEKKLKTNAASGLSPKAARSRYDRANGSLFIPSRMSPWRIAGSLFADFALILLLLTSAVAVFFDDSYSVIAILSVTFINICVSFFIYYRSQRTLESLESFYRPTVHVIRGGKLYNMDYRYVVQGDVLLFERGDIVCADVRLVTSDSLAVSMRVNKDDYIYLEKFAKGNIRPNENDATKYVNIIHAGSVIEHGSARGIVTAVGRYTYLGAMTGGIAEINRDKTPVELKRLKRFCSQLSMISLIAVLPFCIISFFLSQTQGANVTLSAAFLTALAISASVSSQLATTLYKAFFINNIKKLIFSKDAAVVRSADALEQFSKADYLFILDGSAFSDGELEFQNAMTFEGEWGSFEDKGIAQSSLSALVGIYTMADKRSLSAGISENAEYEKGLGSFCKLCKIDHAALSIRYPQISHYPVIMKNVTDSVKYTDAGRDKLICISYTPLIFDECREVFVGKNARPIGVDGVLRLKRYWNSHLENGKKIMIITVLDMQTNIRCFVGMLVFGVGVDAQIHTKISALARSGLKTMVFSGKRDINLPNMPEEIKKLPSVSIEYLKKNQKSITSNFGKYIYYQDSTEQDIAEFVDHIHAQKKRVAIIGFSDYATSAIEKADVFISCAPIQPRISGYLYEEIESLDTSGGISDASCIQMVKNEADILIPRPKKERGGINSVIMARKAGNCAYRNLKQFVRYMICAQFIRLCTVAVPMLLGSIALDARHILFCSFIIDLASFALFSISNDTYSEQKGLKDWWDGKIKIHISEDRRLFISALCASAALIILPRIVGFLGWGGQYLYEEGCSFAGLVYLHLTVFFVLRFGIPSNYKRILKNVPLVVCVIGILMIFSLVFLIEPLRPFFSLEMGNPFPYFFISFVPSVLFAFLYYFLGNKKSRN
jgi:hypothetical protein